MQLISIIIPCYNQAEYLTECVNSVIEQKYDNWECIIVNDGSPDNTEPIANELCRKDSRIKYLKKENGGLSSARNAGIKVSTGKYILPLDADDKISPIYLEKAIKILEERSEVKVVYGNSCYFGAFEGVFDPGHYSLKRLALGNVIYCSAIYRRSDFKKYGPYDEKLIYGFEDWDLWLSILKNGGEVIKISDVVFYYRRYNRPSMVDNFQDQSKLDFSQSLVYQNHQDFYTKMFGNPIKVIWDNENLNRNLEKIRKSIFYKVFHFVNKRIERIRKKLK